MSLTSILEQKPFKELFKNEIGDIKPLFKSDDGEPFPKGLKMTIPPIEGVQTGNLSNIGTCFDFLYRSFLQRINGTSSSVEEFFIVQEGLDLLLEDGITSNDDYRRILEKIQEAEDLRFDYSHGKNVNMEKLIKGLLTATYCQNYYRARGHERHGGYLNVSEIEYLDVKNLIEKSEVKLPSFATFKSEFKLATFNPVMSTIKEIGGSDADLIVDNALIDFKTTKKFGCLAKNNDQIIGYYLLDEYINSKPSLKYNIKRLGIYFSRYTKYVYVDIEDLKRQVDLDYLADTFFKMAKNEIDPNTYIPRKK